MVNSVRSDYGMGIGRVIVDDETNTPKVSQKVAGLDIEEYISAVKDAKKAQEKPYQDKIDKNTKTLAALSTFQTKLQSVQALAQTMANRISSTQPIVTTDVFDSHTVNTTTSTGMPASGIVNLSAFENAYIGSFSLTVNQLASYDLIQGQITTASPSDPLNLSGSFSVGSSVGTNETITLTPDMSLLDVQNAINNVSNTTQVSCDLSMISGGANMTYALKFKAQQSGMPLILGNTSGTPLASLGINQATTNKICGELRTANEATALALSGSLTVGVQSGSTATVAITSDMTLTDVINSINAQTATTGVTASYDMTYYSSPSSYQIKLSAASSTNVVTISDSGGVINGLGLDVPTSDFNDLCANLTVDGTVYKKRNNSVSDIVTGVTMDLNSASTTVITGTVSQDKTAFVSQFDNFITAYNDLISFYNDETKAKIGADGTYNGAGDGADLFGNRFVQDCMMQIKSSLTGGVPGASLNVSTLFAMGTGIPSMGLQTQPDGTILLADQSAFNNAVGTSFSDIQVLMQNTVATSDVNYRVKDVPANLPNQLGNNPITTSLSWDSTGVVTANFIVDGVSYAADVFGNSTGLTLIGRNDAGNNNTLLAGLSITYSGPLAGNPTTDPATKITTSTTVNQTASATATITQGRMAELDAILTSFLNQNTDPATGKKMGSIFSEVDVLNSNSSTQKKIIDKIEVDIKKEGARLERSFERVYKATFELENIMSMIESFNKSNR